MKDEINGRPSIHRAIPDKTAQRMAATGRGLRIARHVEFPPVRESEIKIIDSIEGRVLSGYHGVRDARAVNGDDLLESVLHVLLKRPFQQH